jgi:predicted cation transporter
MLGQHYAQGRLYRFYFLARKESKMFKVPTLFVIGAGAGFDIGMPVGEKLSGEIAKKLNIKFESGVRKVSGDDNIMAALISHAQLRGENVNDYLAAGRSITQGIEYTRSIDSFLNTHNSLEKQRILAN